MTTWLINGKNVGDGNNRCWRRQASVLTDKRVRTCRSRRTYELREAAYRQTAGSRHKLQQPDPFFVVHLLHHLQGKNKPLVFLRRSQPLLCACVRVCVPARTSGSVCCSWCSVCKWCSSASRPGRSPASRRASTRRGGNMRSSAKG